MVRVNNKMNMTKITGQEGQKAGKAQVLSNRKEYMKYTRAPSRWPMATLKITGIVSDLFFFIGLLFRRIIGSRYYQNEISEVKILKGRVKKTEEVGDTEKKVQKVFYGFYHGLGGHPGNMDPHRKGLLKQLKKKSKKNGEYNIAIHQPYIKDKGTCPLSEAVEDVYAKVKEWAEEHEGAQIVLDGSSNGALIAASVAHRLKEDGVENPVTVFCNAGPFFGTRLMNKPNMWKPLRNLWKWTAKKVFSETAVEQFSYGSEKGIEVVRNVRVAADKGVKFHFLGSLCDTMVNFESIFPSEVTDSEEHIYKFNGHMSTVSASKKDVVEKMVSIINNE